MVSEIVISAGLLMATLRLRHGGQPALSALQGAHELLAQQEVVGPLADKGLVVVEVLAGRPQAEQKPGQNATETNQRSSDQLNI